jgi:hypothetical protein
MRAAPDQAGRLEALHGLGHRRLGHPLLASELADPQRPVISASAVAASGPHQGQTPADTALSQGHIILAARLDSGAAEAASPYG